MKLNWIGSVLFAAALTIPASAQISVYIGHPPPRARYERRGPLPGPGYTWINGYWSPQGGQYEWVPGRWDRPPYRGRPLGPPPISASAKGWQLREGHWDRDEHGRTEIVVRRWSLALVRWLLPMVSHTTNWPVIGDQRRSTASLGIFS